LLDARQRLRRQRSQVLRHLQRGLRQVLVRHHAVDEPVALCRFRADELAQQQQLHRAPQAHHALQQVGAAELRRDPDACERQAKARLVRGDPQVACQRNGGTTAHRDAIDGRDHRLVQGLQQASQHVGAVADAVAPLLRGHIPPALERVLHVAARAERIAHARDHQHPHRGIMSRVLAHLCDLARGRVPERIAALRTVDAHPGDGVAFLVLQVGDLHGGKGHTSNPYMSGQYFERWALSTAPCRYSLGNIATCISPILR